MATDDPDDRGEARDPTDPVTAAAADAAAAETAAVADSARADSARAADSARVADSARAALVEHDRLPLASARASAEAGRVLAAEVEHDRLVELAHPGTAAAAAAAARESEPGATRRRVLQLATCAIGGGIGAAILVPAVRLLRYPVGRAIVSTGTEPIDAIAVGELGEEPVRVPMVVHEVRDAWAAERNVVQGAAWIRRGAKGEISVLSSVCPHKGCAIGFTPAARRYECPCHGATFDLAGQRLSGPSERGLDPLPFTVEGDRVKVSWLRYQLGGADRKPA